MRSIDRALVVLALMAPATMQAQTGELALGTQPGSRMWVEGGSSVRSWSCDATLVEASVNGEAVPATASAKEVSAAAKRATLTVPVAKLDCRNGTMNEHMRKALKADAHKEIHYRIDKWELTPRSDDEGTVTTSGTLVMSGAEKPITVELTAKRTTAGTWQLQGSKTIRMTEWGIKPPTLMLGTMKVKDPVTVRFDLVLERK
jgi:polyisoprenoid-binding protein YceI